MKPEDESNAGLWIHEERLMFFRLRGSSNVHNQNAENQQFHKSHRDIMDARGDIRRNGGSSCEGTRDFIVESGRPVHTKVELYRLIRKEKSN
jgi:hypothetical protein